MAGYKNRTITLRFDGTTDHEDLGEDIWVTIRNPKLMSADKLTPREVVLNPDGSPSDPKDAMAASCELMAGLIVAWNVYDAADEAEEPAPLGTANADNVAKLPMTILTAISDELAAINPN